jgi:hypothetical protein
MVVQNSFFTQKSVAQNVDSHISATGGAKNTNEAAFESPCQGRSHEPLFVSVP